LGLGSAAVPGPWVETTALVFVKPLGRTSRELAWCNVPRRWVRKRCRFSAMVAQAARFARGWSRTIQLVCPSRGCQNAELQRGRSHGWTGTNGTFNGQSLLGGANSCNKNSESCLPGSCCYGS